MLKNAGHVRCVTVLLGLFTFIATSEWFKSSQNCEKLEHRSCFLSSHFMGLVHRQSCKECGSTSISLSAVFISHEDECELRVSHLYKNVKCPLMQFYKDLNFIEIHSGLALNFSNSSVCRTSTFLH